MANMRAHMLPRHSAAVHRSWSPPALHPVSIALALVLGTVAVARVEATIEAGALGRRAWPSLVGCLAYSSSFSSSFRVLSITIFRGLDLPNTYLQASRPVGAAGGTMRDWRVYIVRHKVDRRRVVG